MQDRVPANPGRVLITPENGSAAYYATVTRADNPTQKGTPLNKASLLKDATAALFGLGTDAVPDDALNAIKTLINGANANADTKAKIATGSYTGTGTYGSSNKNSLTFDFEPKLLVVLMSGVRSVSNEYGFIWVPPDGALGFAATSNVYVPTITVNGNAVLWYQKNAAKWQCNESDTTYNYVAIG